MLRCRDCNSVLLKSETECMACGSPVPKSSRTKKVRAKFAGILCIAFLLSLLMLGAAFFAPGRVPGIPSLATCIPVCIVLLVTWSSAKQMTDGNQ